VTETTSIRHEEHVLTRRAVPGPPLYAVRATPRGDAKATVGILHGYADHAARYLHVMDTWAEAGIASIAVDMRGHGRAEGQRGACKRFDEFLEDAQELATLVRESSRGGACFLFGHSFGGLVASASAIEAPGTWRGLLLSAPFFGLALEVPPAKLVAGRLLSRVAPTLSMNSGMHGADMTKDPARAAAYDADPLVFKKANVRFFSEAQRAQSRYLARAGELRLPLFETMGTADRVAKISSARAFFDGAASADKVWREGKGGFHEQLNDPEWRELAHEMASWMLARA
jgi:alpha-beta hydrolase superfamily lysophospholipase